MSSLEKGIMGPLSGTNNGLLPSSLYENKHLICLPDGKLTHKVENTWHLMGLSVDTTSVDLLNDKNCLIEFVPQKVLFTTAIVFKSSSVFVSHDNY